MCVHLHEKCLCGHIAATDIEMMDRLLGTRISYTNQVVIFAPIKYMWTKLKILQKKLCLEGCLFKR